MSIITSGEASGSLSSGNTTNSDREDHHHHHHHVLIGKQEVIIQNQDVHNLSSTTTLTKDSFTQLLPPQPKKTRNPPGNPDPSAEVIALSPKTLMAKNRFMCEICSKGFQRDQNLQLHRRGHNLPWKLRQRNANEVVRKRVYVCPEVSCVHHNPARALGDLTGIKKHFSRKHGVKKWSCPRCNKKYAVQSDCKAHSKTCGTREYKCECGTIFSRRDSFITHRAFCDALAEENSKTTLLGQVSLLERQNPILIPTQISNRSELIINDNNIINDDKCYTTSTTTDHHHTHIQPPQELISNHEMINNNKLKTSPPTLDHHYSQDINITHDLQYQNDTTSSSNPTTNSHYMSATALLQKAAQMGPTVGAPGSVMAPISYGLVHHGLITNNNKSNINGNNSGTSNNSSTSSAGFFEGFLFDHRPNQNNDNNDVVLHGAGEDVMTVDFLGIGSSQKQVVDINLINHNQNNNNNNDHEQLEDEDYHQVMRFNGHDDQNDNSDGLSQFEQHVEIMGKHNVWRFDC